MAVFAQTSYNSKWISPYKSVNPRATNTGFVLSNTGGCQDVLFYHDSESPSIRFRRCEMSMYPWNMKVTIYGYEFLFLDHEGNAYGVLVPPDADMEDTDYVDALTSALRLYEYIEIFNELIEAHRSWYRLPYSNDFEQYHDRTKALHNAHKFLQQDELTKPEWVAKFADDLASNTRPPKPSPESKPKKKSEKPGFVYLLKSDKGHYKIGRTVDPESRGKTFGIQLPFDVSFECLIQTDNMNGLEAELHLRFADKRTTGEWFDLTPEDIEYIKGLVK